MPTDTGCRALFEQRAGAKDVNYPEDVLGTGWEDKGRWVVAWAGPRRDLISSLVQEITAEAHRLRPGLKVSLAAWDNPGEALRDVAQDWFTWIENGWFDFICPMDYQTDIEWVRRPVQQQVAVAGNKPVYAGLGAFLLSSLEELATQISVAREQGAAGFCLFSYDMKHFHGWMPQVIRLI
jgi:uncharacterized lipoprotein YddW (UPF0748 family)